MLLPGAAWLGWRPVWLWLVLCSVVSPFTQTLGVLNRVQIKSNQIKSWQLVSQNQLRVQELLSVSMQNCRPKLATGAFSLMACCSITRVAR